MSKARAGGAGGDGDFEITGEVAVRCGYRSKSGVLCKRRALPGMEPPLCAGHIGPRATGPLSQLTEEVAERLVALLAAGNLVKTACQAAGVKLPTFYHWLDCGNPDRRARRYELHRRFRRDVEAARSAGVARNVETIANAAERDWRAAAWLLERMEPERFAKAAAARSNAAGGGSDADGQTTGASGGEDGDPFAALAGDELAERRASRS